jgi:hypothetical protein
VLEVNSGEFDVEIIGKIAVLAADAVTDLIIAWLIFAGRNSIKASSIFNAPMASFLAAPRPLSAAFLRLLYHPMLLSLSRVPV